MEIDQRLVAIKNVTTTMEIVQARVNLSSKGHLCKTVIHARVGVEYYKLNKQRNMNKVKLRSIISSTIKYFWWEMAIYW